MAEREANRNGQRERVWESRVGEIPLRISEVRRWELLPEPAGAPLAEREGLTLAVTQQAYVEGVSTRRAENLLQALGMTGIGKSRVFRICKELDEVVETFRSRPLECQCPHV